MLRCEWYFRSRLQDPTLLAGAVVVPVAAGIKDLAVPCGGRRVSGGVSVDRDEQARVIRELSELEGFPNVRADGPTSIEWGDPMPEPNERAFYEYIERMRTRGEMFGYSDYAIQQFVHRVVVHELMELDGVGVDDIEDEDQLSVIQIAYREMLGLPSDCEMWSD